MSAVARVSMRRRSVRGYTVDLIDPVAGHVDRARQIAVNLDIAHVLAAGLWETLAPSTYPTAATTAC